MNIFFSDFHVQKRFFGHNSSFLNESDRNSGGYLPKSTIPRRSKWSKHDHFFFHYFSGGAEGRKHGRTEGRKQGRTDARTDGRKEARTDGRTDGRKEARTDGRTEGRTDGRKDGRTDGRKDARTEESPC